MNKTILLLAFIATAASVAQAAPHVDTNAQGDAAIEKILQQELAQLQDLDDYNTADEQDDLQAEQQDDDDDDEALLQELFANNQSPAKIQWFRRLVRKAFPLVRKYVRYVRRVVPTVRKVVRRYGRKACKYAFRYGRRLIG